MLLSRSERFRYIKELRYFSNFIWVKLNLIFIPSLTKLVLEIKIVFKEPWGKCSTNKI